jgi:small subunit ribosomal protein S21
MATKPNVTYTVKRDEPIEKALRGFKRLCERAGIKKSVRAKRYYEKPSDKRRREMRKRVRNKRRAERKAKQAMDRRLKKARRRSSSLAQGGAHKPAEAKPAAATTEAPAATEAAAT